MGPEPYWRLCQQVPPLACNGCMHTEPQTAITRPRLGHYRIDPARSVVTFRTRHLFGLAPVRGTFAIASGSAEVAEPVTASAISADIDVSSFRTKNGQRDASVLSRRFLDPDRYPAIAFRSDQIDADRQVVIGALTVREVTRPVTLSVSHLAAGNQSFTARATTRIDRTEFGITAARGLAARFLDLRFDVVWVRS